MERFDSNKPSCHVVSDQIRSILEALRGVPNVATVFLDLEKSSFPMPLMRATTFCKFAKNIAAFRSIVQGLSTFPYGSECLSETVYSGNTPDFDISQVSYLLFLGSDWKKIKSLILFGLCLETVLTRHPVKSRSLGACSSLVHSKIDLSMFFNFFGPLYFQEVWLMSVRMTMMTGTSSLLLSSFSSS